MECPIIKNIVVFEMGNSITSTLAPAPAPVPVPLQIQIQIQNPKQSSQELAQVFAHKKFLPECNDHYKKLCGQPIPSEEFQLDWDACAAKLYYFDIEIKQLISVFKGISGAEKLVKELEKLEGMRKILHKNLQEKTFEDACVEFGKITDQFLGLLISNEVLQGHLVVTQLNLTDPKNPILVKKPEPDPKSGSGKKKPAKSASKSVGKFQK